MLSFHNVNIYALLWARYFNIVIPKLINPELYIDTFSYKELLYALENDPDNSAELYLIRDYTEVVVLISLKNGKICLNSITTRIPLATPGINTFAEIRDTTMIVEKVDFEDIYIDSFIDDIRIYVRNVGNHIFDFLREKIEERNIIKNRNI